jgi:hypothetical protein
MASRGKAHDFMKNSSPGKAYLARFAISTNTGTLGRE